MRFAAALLLLLSMQEASASLRFVGAPITRSVQNESDAAIDRACSWLADRQGEDGGWPEGIKATAACLLALAGSGEDLPPAWRRTIDRGVAWLANRSGESSPEELAWRGMALAVLAPRGVCDTAAIACPAGASTNAACAILEHAMILGLDRAQGAAASPAAGDPVFDLLGCEPNSKAAFEKAYSLYWLAGDAPLADFGAERVWWAVHALNRATGGELPQIPGYERPGWRGAIANGATTSQAIAPRGRGHWGASVEETAFTILLLKEL